MPKFKVGDTVRVKTYMQGDNYYNGLYFSPGMEQFRGEVFIIRNLETLAHETRYTLNVSGGWVWSDDFLELVDTDTEKLYKEIREEVTNDKV